jgi:hypothetical protein
VDGDALREGPDHRPAPSLPLCVLHSQEMICEGLSKAQVLQDACRTYDLRNILTEAFIRLSAQPKLATPVHIVCAEDEATLRKRVLIRAIPLGPVMNGLGLSSASQYLRS